VEEKAPTATPLPEPGVDSGEKQIDVVAIPADRVGAYWPSVAEFVWPAFEHFPGEMDLPTLLRRLSIGEGTLWVAFGDGRFFGGCITQLYDYPAFRAVQIVGLGGVEFSRWHAEMNVWLDRYAKLHGATRLEFYGRRGWEKMLPEFKVNRIMMVREL